MATMSYGRAMTWLAAEAPERVALVVADADGARVTRTTRAALDARANRLARCYRAHGLGAGDLLTLLLPNGAEFLAATLAAWKLGATPQPLSLALPARERGAILELAQPKLIVGGGAPIYIGRGAGAGDGGVAGADGAVGDAVAAAASELSARAGCPVLPAGFTPAPEFSNAPLAHDHVTREQRVMASGGSTGRPKLIVDKTPALTDPARAENFMRPRGTALVPGPLVHAGPFIVAFQCLLSGGTLVLMSRFRAARALALIEQERVDWALFVPTMMQRIWKLGAAARARCDLSSLQTVMCSGAPSPAWLKRAWISWLGAQKIYEAYGGTERIAGCMIRGDEWLAHAGSVGKPPTTATGVPRMKALRADGSECAPYEIGEIFMLPAKAPSATAAGDHAVRHNAGTYRYIGAQAVVNSKGWETLGDLGHFDADGYLYLADRKTDMIVSGGANIYPAEVEAALDAHERVRSCAVIGLPDEDLGQRVHAIVDAPAGVGVTALRAHLETHIARYKIPRTFEFVRTPLRDDAGKVRRSALREARVARRT